ncbi:heterogeneous nuclear ribonucleoprotein 87F-like [Mytilus edulis]|uniref:heterogeneous nuclear ribonucleoprotein 87F-like n=1 Tax=Mytilus edulis TaxID=6550 RepID=UPI0039EFF847
MKFSIILVLCLVVSVSGTAWYRRNYGRGGDGGVWDGGNGGNAWNNGRGGDGGRWNGGNGGNGLYGGSGGNGGRWNGGNGGHGWKR